MRQIITAKAPSVTGGGRIGGGVFFSSLSLLPLVRWYSTAIELQKYDLFFI